MEPTRGHALMSAKTSGFFVAAVVGLVAVACCAGLLLPTAVVSAGVVARSAAHGLWLLSGLVVAAAVGALIVGLRWRRAVAPDRSMRREVTTP